MTAILGVGAILGSAWAYGVLLNLSPRSGDRRENGILAIAVGLAFQSSFVFLLGYLKLLYEPVLLALLCVPVLGLGLKIALRPDTWKKRDLHRSVIQSSAGEIWLPRIAWGMAGVLYSIALLEALHMDLCPDRYHVADARSFLNNHCIEFLPGEIISCYPKAIEMLFVLGLMFEPESASALLNASFLPLTALCLDVLFRAWGGPAAGAVSVLWFAAQVMVHKYATMGFIDMGAMFFGAAALLPLQRFLKEGRLRNAALAGVLVGMATASKITAGLLLVLPICAALTGVGIFFLDKKSPTFLKGAAVLGAVALMTYSPYMVRNWIGSGSPFAPTLAEHFPLHPDFDLALERFEAVHPLRSGTFLDRPLWSLRFYLEQIAYDGSSAALLLPVSIPLLLAGSLWKRNRFGVFLALSAGLSFLMYAVAGPSKSSRFAVPVAPLFSGAAAAVTWWAVSRLRDRWAIAFASVFALVATGIVLQGIHAYRGVYLHRPLLSGRERSAFLREVDPSWPQLQYLNQQLSPKDRIAFHRAAVRWRFLEIPFSSPSYWGPSHAEYLWGKSQLADPKDPEEEFRRRLEEGGINYLLVGKAHLIFPQGIFEEVKEWPDTLLLRLAP